jgi:DNA-directed RNA polymerase subunit RPC12/RpoP
MKDHTCTYCGGTVLFYHYTCNTCGKGKSPCS